MDEGPYEVQGVSVGETVLATEAPRKGRENTGQKVGHRYDIIIKSLHHYDIIVVITSP